MRILAVAALVGLLGAARVVEPTSVNVFVQNGDVPATGLTKSNFVLTDNGVVQVIDSAVVDAEPSICNASPRRQPGCAADAGTDHATDREPRPAARRERPYPRDQLRRRRDAHAAPAAGDAAAIDRADCAKRRFVIERGDPLRVDAAERAGPAPPDRGAHSGTRYGPVARDRSVVGGRESFRRRAGGAATRPTFTSLGEVIRATGGAIYGLKGDLPSAVNGVLENFRGCTACSGRPSRSRAKAGTS